MAKENANDKLKKWLEIGGTDVTKVTKLQSVKFQVDHLFELATKNAHVLDKSEYMELWASISFKTIYWLIEQAEKVDKLQKQLDAKIMFVSNEKDEDMYVLQEKVIRYEKTLKYYAKRGFNKAKEVLED